MLLPNIDSKTRHLVFDGVPDSRYSFPVWSWMSSRGMRVFFDDGKTQQTIGGKFFGEIEVLSAASEHREQLKSITSN